ncbi:MAG: hypothetical protein VB089_16955 [Anaerolineaceae bacterium]|nr:hypothetical protein [Anaerolineaceae bacterium]
MSSVLVAIVLMAHALVHWSLTAVPLPTEKMHTPFWPGPGRAAVDPTWLLMRAGASPETARWLGVILMGAASLGFVLAGLGLLGVPGLYAAWRMLAGGAALVSLLMFALYWHPWLVVGAGLNGLILAALILGTFSA